MTNPKLTASISTRSGSDPDAIDEARHVYGDGLTFDLSHLEDERCERSASGLHSYKVTDGVYICICCGADGGEV